MIQLNKKHDWWLDDNGISVVTSSGANIVDLRNDCEVTSLEVQGNQILLQLTIDETSRTMSKSVFLLKINGVQDAHDLTLLHEQVFEGLYDYTESGVNLCLGDECMLIRGSGLKIELFNEAAQSLEHEG